MNSYIYNFNVRCMIEDKNIVVRKGIWNTTDGYIPFSLLKNTEVFLNIIKKLDDGVGVTDEDIDNLDKNDQTIFFDMLKEDFIINSNLDSAENIVNVLIGRNQKINKKAIHFTLITDSDFVSENIDSLSKNYNYSYNLINKDIINKLSDINLLSQINSLDFEKTKLLYRNILGDTPIFVILSKPNIALLRNINRLINEKQPLFIGVIDGPFMIFLTLLPGVTACWECFEQRMMSHIQDHTLYNKFSEIKVNNSVNPTYNLHLIHLLSMGLQEIIVWSHLKMSKFMGRVLSLYLPTYEFHFHDVNRTASCKRCGYIAKQTSSDLNISIQNIIDKLLHDGKDKK